MSYQEYEQADAEVVGMVNGNFRCREHGRFYLASEQEITAAQHDRAEVRRKQIAAESALKEANRIRDEAEEDICSHFKLRIINALAPVFIGLSWVLGAAEGLADPLFAGISAAICALWAVVNFKWGTLNV